MKQTRDYSKSIAPRYDALQDLIAILGDRWPKCNEYLKGVTDPDQFADWADFAGVQGVYPEVWYDHIHGQGAWIIAGGPSTFTDGLELQPITIRKVFARYMIKDLTATLSALAEYPHRAQEHELANLSTDDFTAVEEWVQAMIERTEQDEESVTEEALMFKRFQEHVEDKLIDRMIYKVQEQINSQKEDRWVGGYVLAPLGIQNLTTVQNFLLSYKQRGLEVIADAQV